MENGRNWIEDNTGTVARPKFTSSDPLSEKVKDLDRGTEVSIKLTGKNIRPKDLSWNNATTADQWLALLRMMTPAGGIYLSGNSPHKINIYVDVIDQTGVASSTKIDVPRYFYPHLAISKSGNLRDFLTEQQKRINRGIDPSNTPPKFTKLNGLWGEWSNDELLNPKGDDCPIQLRLDREERELAKSSGISLYIYMAFSTDLWDNLNDNHLRLRKSARTMHGGLQLATRHMPQGMPLTIPMTNNIGFQNLAHVVAHFENAEPDLGRKGFQPEFVHLAEKIAVSAVTAFRRRHFLLRKPGVAKIFNDELEIEQWIRDQEKHETEHSLSIKGTGLFMPSEELPIRSEPLVEQDVVALFNQMLSSGLIRAQTHS